MPAVAKTDRAEILRCSLRLLAEGGMRALSLRAVAAALGIAPNAMYHHFADRAALNEALAEEAARRLGQAIRRAGARAGEGSALQALTRAYLRFAAQEPHLYDMLLGVPSQHCDGDERTQLWVLVLGITSMHFGESHGEVAATSILALLHGGILLSRSGVLGGQDPAQAIAFGMNAWEQMKLVRQQK